MNFFFSYVEHFVPNGKADGTITPLYDSSIRFNCCESRGGLIVEVCNLLELRFGSGIAFALCGSPPYHIVNSADILLVGSSLSFEINWIFDFPGLSVEHLWNHSDA